MSINLSSCQFDVMLGTLQPDDGTVLLILRLSAPAHVHLVIVLKLFFIGIITEEI
jgi:hypothetical protein